MTREEAIKFLYSVAEDLGFIDAENYTCKDGEKMRDAIKVLERESCEDAVSRQSVLDLMQLKMGGRELYKTIYDLPPVTPAVCIAKINYSKEDMQEVVNEKIKELTVEQRWIPVKERLPEESLNSVIGWDAYRERCVFVQYIDGHFQITGRNESFNIVAWQPVPEPYKPEKESEE